MIDGARLVLADVSPRAWDEFHVDGHEPALSPELAACWQRARALGAPPAGPRPEDALVRGAELRARADEVAVLRSVGDAILDRATARAADRDFLLLLADPDGVVVRTSGGGAFADTAARVRLIEGACWGEAVRGTNAIGTAAATGRATEVHGRAHYGRAYGELVCYAAPVRGLDGRTLAVVDATSRVERADPVVATLIAETAAALERLVRFHGYASAGATVARALGRTIDRVREPALLVEVPGTIARANGAARELLGANVVGRDVLAATGVAWRELVHDALAGGGGGVPVTLAGGRAWRLHVEPIAATSGAIVSALVVCEPGRLAVRARRPSNPALPAASEARVEVDPFAPIFREDAAVVSAVAWSRRLAASDVPIVLLAETGAGKELFARAIHDASPRAAGPWHAINCGAIAPGLLEAELFGYAPGAFTGAERNGRPGLFHAAAGGTLFLDELAEMSPAMQAALLRVVETQTFRRVGDTRLERTDVRIVAATCRDLPALVASGGFRQDLYYRLKGATVRVPPLRERTDLVALAEFLLGDGELAPEAARAIATHAWPGNVRELKSVLEVARIAAGAPRIELAHLPPELAAPATTATVDAGTMDDVERAALVRALAASDGNVTLAARALGLARSTVQRRMRRFGLVGQ